MPRRYFSLTERQGCLPGRFTSTDEQLRRLWPKIDLGPVLERVPDFLSWPITSRMTIGMSRCAMRSVHGSILLSSQAVRETAPHEHST